MDLGIHSGDCHRWVELERRGLFELQRNQGSDGRFKSKRVQGPKRVEEEMVVFREQNRE